MSDEQKKERITLVGLNAQHLYRIKAAELKFSGGGELVQITGRNKQGKTSLLKIVAGALGGGRQVAETAVNFDSPDGTGQGRLELSNGFTIERRHTANNPKGSLAIVGPDGGKYGQKKLDEWVGPLSFDPLAFYRLDAQSQRDTLLRSGSNPELPDQLAKIKDQVAELAAERTPLIRRIQIAERTEAPEGERPEPIDAGKELAALAKLEEEKMVLDAKMEEVRAADRAADQKADEALKAVRQAEELEAKAAEWRAEAAQKREASERLADEARAAEERLTAGLEPLVAKMTEVKERIYKAESHNQGLAPWREYDRLMAEAEEAKTQRDKFDKEIADLRDQEKALLQEAGIDIPGLSFTDDGQPLLNGLPLSEASGREKWEFVVEVAERAGGQLGVCLLDEASGVDDEGMESLAAVAAERGFQVFLTRLSPVGPGEVVTCEDGVAWNEGGEP